MKYFDLVLMERMDEGLAERLGYGRIFIPSEIEVMYSVSKKNGDGKYIVRSQKEGTLDRAIRDCNALGIIIDDSLLVRHVIRDLKRNDKALFLVASELTRVEKSDMLRNIYRMRNLLSFAMHADVDIALITLAKGPEELLSSRQMLEIAKFLGADRERAKGMLALIGDIYDS